jgi:hypothetical protein
MYWCCLDGVVVWFGFLYRFFFLPFPISDPEEEAKLPKSNESLLFNHIID